jgi:Zn-finger nucleic acid-binding protein
VSSDLQFGIEALKRGEFTAAVRHLELAARETPDSAAAHLCLGVAYSECHRTRDAVRALTLAVRLDPSNTRARYNLGIALERAGQVDEAVEALRAAVALDPNHSKAREALARLAGEAGPAPDTIILPRPRAPGPEPVAPPAPRVEPSARPEAKPSPTPAPRPATAAPPAGAPWRLCPECEARNAATARVCWECGAFLRAAIVETCPYCTAALRKVTRGAVEAKACEGCGGVWLERSDLEALVQAPRKQRVALLAAIRRARTGTILRINPALICARCQLVMLGGPMHEITSYPIHVCPNCSASFVGQRALEEIATGRSG